MFPTVQRLKSPHYFDLNYHHGETWYRSHFASARAGGRDRRTPLGGGEPVLLFHPLAPAGSAG